MLLSDDFIDWGEEFREHHGYGKEVRDAWKRFHKEVIEPFRNYKLPAIVRRGVSVGLQRNIWYRAPRRLR